MFDCHLSTIGLARLLLAKVSNLLTVIIIIITIIFRHSIHSYIILATEAIEKFRRRNKKKNKENNAKINLSTQAT